MVFPFIALAIAWCFLGGRIIAVSEIWGIFTLVVSWFWVQSWERLAFQASPYLNASMRRVEKNDSSESVARKEGDGRGVVSGTVSGMDAASEPPGRGLRRVPLTTPLAAPGLVS